MRIRNAYYIKLGTGGCWEKDSISNGLIRFGWADQSLADINGGRWETIEQQLRSRAEVRPQVSTTDLNRLRDLAESTSEDVWITFSDAKLWWTRPAATPVEEDATSKLRRTLLPWSDRSENKRLLVVNELPGRLAMVRRFSGTVCQIRETALLQRVVEGTRSALAADIATRRNALCEKLEKGIRELHPRDYETLVDLVFRHAGWVRVSVLGKQEKDFDLELREPITQDRYVVQVKSSAGVDEVRHSANAFSPEDFRKVFFVVHTPTAAVEAMTDVPEHLEIVAPRRLAELTLGAGLSEWVENKVT